MINIDRSKEIRVKRGNTDWWIHEQAMVGNNGKTYMAYYTDMGEIRVKEFDAKCSRVPSHDVCLCRLNCNYADEHNAPSICVMEDGTIIVVYTGHAATNDVHYRVTTRPYDIYSFGEEKCLSYAASATYAQISENVSRGELWFFCRIDRVTWEFRYSRDKGETFSEPVKFLISDAGGLFYFDIHRQLIAERKKGVREQWMFALYGHPRISKDHTIRSGIFNSEGTLLRMNGEKTDVNLYTGGLIDLESLDVVYPSPEGTTCRLLSVSPTPPYRVGFASFELNRPETITYYCATFRDGAWQRSAPIAACGEFLSPTPCSTAPRPIWAAWPFTTVWATRDFPSSTKPPPLPTVSTSPALTAKTVCWRAITPPTAASPMLWSRPSAKSRGSLASRSGDPSCRSMRRTTCRSIGTRVSTAHTRAAGIATW